MFLEQHIYASELNFIKSLPLVEMVQTFRRSGYGLSWLAKNICAKNVQTSNSCFSIMTSYINMTCIRRHDIVNIPMRYLHGCKVKLIQEQPRLHGCSSIYLFGDKNMRITYSLTQKRWKVITIIFRINCHINFHHLLKGRAS